MGAITIWEGRAPTSSKVAQVASASIDAVDIVAEITTFTVTISGLVVSQESDTNVNTTTAALVVKLNAETDARFSAITWTNPGAPSGDITATADVAGVQFKATLAAVGGDGTVTDFTDDTPSAGPGHWNTAMNWSTRTVPVDTDIVVIGDSAQSIIYDIDQSAVELLSLTVKSTFTGTIGLPINNTSGFVEGRDTHLTIGATTMTIDGSGSGRINIELSAGDLSNVIVTGSGTAAVSGVPPILLRGGVGGSSTLHIRKGTVGAAWYADEVAEFTTVNMDFITNQNTDAVLLAGTGAAITTLTKNGGSASISSNLTTLIQTAGSVSINGAATVGTMKLRGGTCFYKSIGTLASVIASGGVLDFRADSRARTVTTAVAYAGASIYDPLGTVAWTNDIDLIEATLEEVSLDLGKNITIAITAL